MSTDRADMETIKQRVRDMPVYCAECSDKSGVTTVHSPESHTIAAEIEQQREGFIHALAERKRLDPDAPDVVVMGNESELAIRMNPAQQAAYRELGYDYATAAHLAIVDGIIEQGAVDQDMRLKRCGLVHREDQSNSHRWVEPSPTRHEGRIKTLPLFMVKPVPGLEIHALDGEKYVLPKDFKGDWFSVKSPTGNGLVP